jgi:hypothetical protein
VKQYPNLSSYVNNVIELLKHSNIPTKKWFDNDLKGKVISYYVYNVSILFIKERDRK